MKENNVNSASPIGVFDSGVGGLSVLRHIRDLLPQEDLIYIADSGYAPYGDKSLAWIRKRSLELAALLAAKDVKAMVVACNTATAAALQALRERHDIPVIGMEPAVKPAALATKTGIVGVLATVGTLKSAHFAALLERYKDDVDFVTQPCPGLVECVENGAFDEIATRKLVKGYVDPLLARRADTLVLGCTHYPFLRPLIEEIAGPSVSIIDTGAAVARQVRRRLETLETMRRTAGTSRIYTSGRLEKAEPVLRRLWPEAARISAL